MPEAEPPKRTWNLYLIALLSFLFIGLLLLICWLLFWQFRESTDDSYVAGNMILITPQESGIITTILTDNTQLVVEGQPLVELDRHDYEIALDRSKADLASKVRTVEQLFLKVNELEAKKEGAEASLVQASLDYDHRAALVADKSVSLEDFEHSVTTLAASLAFLKEVEKQLESARAEVQGTTLATHPLIEFSKAELRQSFLALHRCQVLAPTRGIITQRRAQVGQWVTAHDPLMALVPIDEIWVDANFREVSLKHLRIGQKVTLIADMYGSDVQYHGRLVGLNPGSGSVFSILPPQNATGNWIKIVQRIPVKISLDPDELLQHPLVLGLSMTVYVDTHDRSGRQLPNTLPSQPIYSSNIYRDELAGVEPLIEQIILENQSNAAE